MAKIHPTAITGRWQIRATNFPMWLSGRRRGPSIRYGLLGTEPLRLSDRVEYHTRKGRQKTIRGIDTGSASGFTWRGWGLLWPLRSRWRVAALHGGVLVIRFEKSLLTPAGVDVLARPNTSARHLRKQITHNPAAWGLTPADLRSLKWL